MRNSTEVHTNFQLTLDVDRRQRRLLRAREIRKGDCERRYIGRISPMTWVPTNADSVGQLVVMGLEMGARLRRRIETGPARPRYIRTERGAGYLFAVPVQTIY